MRIPAIIFCLCAAGAAVAQEADPTPLPSDRGPGLMGDRRPIGHYPTLGATTPTVPLGGEAKTADEILADPEARMIFTALAARGCVIAPADVAPTLAPLGISFEAARRVFTDLEVSGLGTQSSDGRMSIPASLCPPPQPEASYRDQVLQDFSDAGCTLSEEDILTALPDLGEPQLQAILAPMQAQGALEIGLLSATLAPPLCGDETASR